MYLVFRLRLGIVRLIALSFASKKPFLKRGAFLIYCYASVSRILFRRTAKTVIYLGVLLPTPSSGTSRFWRDTALHSSKDLAVSLPMLPSELTPSFDGVAVAFASGRLCSHLADRSAVRQTGPDGCYPLLCCRSAFRRTLNFAAACGRQNWRVFGLSSPQAPSKEYYGATARRITSEL